MLKIDKYWKHFALAGVLAVGMTGFAATAQARVDHRPADIRTAQQQLKNDGLYNGPIDGIDGHSTRAALRQYQRNNNLRANGKLDRQTRNMLGIIKS